MIISPTTTHPANKSNDWKAFSFKWFLILFLITSAFKFLYLTRVDTFLEENRIWIFILGDISFLVKGIREFFLIICTLFALCAAYIVYTFGFTQKLPWLELFHFLEGKHSITPRQMGITEIDLVKEILARYKALCKFSQIVILIIMIPCELLFILEASSEVRNYQEVSACFLWLSLLHNTLLSDL